MLCSRIPGIGYHFLREQILDFYRLHPRDYVRAFNGMRMAMPRYYADKLYDDDMKEYQKNFVRLSLLIRCSKNGIIILIQALGYVISLISLRQRASWIMRDVPRKN
ncbi:hypothetical protein NXV76_22215, partial [Parabacteroides distasonis]|uniref:hypothetical protein n=1 Tax=Parabacteroides distasonis TaxID=823 RepID=UPI002165AAC0